MTAQITVHPIDQSKLVTVLLVAHGTRNPQGGRLIRDLATATADALDKQVRVAFIDVCGPTPNEVLSELRDEPVVLVPAFLSSGKHVRSDIPRHVAASRHQAVSVSDALGPSPELAWALRDRLFEAGWQPGDGVVLAAAGSSDPHAHCDMEVVATTLSAVLGDQVSIAFCSSSSAGAKYPSVGDAVTAVRDRGYGRVAIASYLLADGLFHTRLHDVGADFVAEPLRLHPAVVDTVCRRARAPMHRWRWAV